MSKQLLFWILWVLSFLFMLWSGWPFAAENRKTASTSMLLFILVGILGWSLYGAAIK